MTIKQPVSGIGHAMEGLRLVMRPELRSFVIIPFLVNLLVFSGLVWLGISQFEHFMNWMLPQDGWLSYLRWLLWPVFALAAVLIVFYTFTAFANLIASPFNSRLAEKTEQLLTGKKPESTDVPLWKDIMPSIWSEIRKMIYFMLRAIPLLILLLIPGINAIASVLWLLFSIWFMAIEYGDYPMGNHGIKFADQHKRLKAKRMTALGFGGGINLLMLIPVVNFLAMPAAVAGATAMWCKSLKQIEK